MAAPAATVRVAPLAPNKRLKAAFKSVITFASQPSLALWTISFTPTGYDGGDPIDIATMEDVDSTGANARHRPTYPRERIMSTPGQAKVAYDPNTISLIISTLLNRTNDQITETFREGSTKAYWGWMRSFIPDELVEGQMPTATVAFHESDWDDANQTVDGPTITSVSGS